MSSSNITLYDLELSGNCYKIRLFLSLIKQPYTLRPVDFLGGEHKRPPGALFDRRELLLVECRPDLLRGGARRRRLQSIDPTRCRIDGQRVPRRVTIAGVLLRLDVGQHRRSRLMSRVPGAHPSRICRLADARRSNVRSRRALAHFRHTLTVKKAPLLDSQENRAASEKITQRAGGA